MSSNSELHPGPGMLLTLLLASCAAPPVDSAAPCPETRWLGAWAAAPSDTTEAYGAQSLRLVLTPLRSGDTVRLRLSNRLGDAPLTLRSVHLGLPEAGAALVPDSQVAVSFGGEPGESVALAAGEERLSDPVDFPLQALQPIAVSAFLSTEGVALTRHAEGLQTSYLAPPEAGDLAASTSGEAFVLTTTERLVLMGLDVLSLGEDGVIALVGDSLTDGTGGVDQDARYPDALARRLLEAGSPLSPVNLGIGGNRVLSDPLLPAFGPALLDRLEADVLAREDLTDVLLFEGINDLGIPPGADADEVLAGLEQAVAALQAPREGRPTPRVSVATLTPAGGASGLYAGHAAAEDERQAVNAAIRAGALGDAVVDFDAAVRDPEDPSRIAPELDGGDGLHLNAEGYARLAGAVDLAALGGRSCVP
ncbi:MAG: SGNH/GDSL hydrolase family protein [Alphaproteobacteria bacterium]|nr:SGNH/GDSL hydrolase family protein [Alphaproteobacteria bacterium]